MLYSTPGVGSVLIVKSDLLPLPMLTFFLDSELVLL